MTEGEEAAVSGEHIAVVGRQAELATLEEYAGASALVLVRGHIGIGKTTLLGEVHRRWRTRGITVVRLYCGNDLEHWDEFGTRAVIESIRNIFHEIGDSRVVTAMAAVNRSSAPESYTSAAARSALFADLVRLFRCLRSNGPFAVLADDVHAAPNPELAVAAAHQAGCTVVATCREDGITAEPTSLSVVAGRVLDLTPLPDDEIDELVAAVAPGVLDESVTPVLRAGLGSLAGNPGAVLGSFEKLVRDGRFADVQGHLCLSDPVAPIALPDDHYLVRQVARFGEPGAQLVALVERMDRFGVDDLLTFAAATGHDLGSCGRMVDELVAAGVLDYDDYGILSISCPALVTVVLAESCPDGVASLHRAIAEHLLRDENVLLPEPTAVADHIALAGAALPPDPSVVALLENEAARVLHGQPMTAARWYRAAFRHCAPGGTDHSRILDTVLRLLVRTGQYGNLGEVVTEAVADGVEEDQRYELAVSAALAAIHTGLPVPDSVYAALAAGESGRAPLEFATGWFAGRESIEAAEVEAVFGAFRAEGPLGSERAEACTLGGEQGDLAVLFKLVLGDEYGEPESGPVAIFRRIMVNYGSGDWQAIPSDARQLELVGPADTALHEASRLLVAEVLGASGDYGGATRWFNRVGSPCLFPALCAWVEIGIAYRSGDYDGARERGWAVYGEIAAKVDGGIYPGLRLFLVRLAFLEYQAENAEKTQAICDDAKRWYARYGGEGLRLAEIMLRGMAERNYAAATEAVEMVRKRGDQSELMRALLVVAFLAEEPRPWYHEAYEIARRLGGDWMRLYIKGYMRDSGVSAPSRRGGDAELSDVEQRIIGLIQQGLTNRQIATAIQVSEKTVENHITRLFAKTGCRSRLDLATASIEGRLVAAPGNRVS